MFRLLLTIPLALALHVGSGAHAIAQSPSRPVEVIALNDAFVTRFFKLRSPTADTKTIEKEIEQLCPQRSRTQRRCHNQMTFVTALINKGWNAKTDRFEDPYTKATAELAAITAMRSTTAAGVQDDAAKSLMEALDMKIKYTKRDLDAFPKPIPARDLALMQKYSAEIKQWHSKL